MASIADLFNPSFLMFLGILVLVVAMLVVYFESKMREQNHKINAMMSLVSTLAEEVNAVKHRQLVPLVGGDKPELPLGISKVDNTLIQVSDDEDTEYDEEEDDYTTEDASSDEEDEQSYRPDDEDDVKVIKLFIN